MLVEQVTKFFWAGPETQTRDKDFGSDRKKKKKKKKKKRSLFIRVAWEARKIMPEYFFSPFLPESVGNRLHSSLLAHTGPNHTRWRNILWLCIIIRVTAWKDDTSLYRKTSFLFAWSVWGCSISFFFLRGRVRRARIGRRTWRANCDAISRKRSRQWWTEHDDQSFCTTRLWNSVSLLSVYRNLLSRYSSWNRNLLTVTWNSLPRFCWFVSHYSQNVPIEWFSRLRWQLTADHNEWPSRNTIIRRFPTRRYDTTGWKLSRSNKFIICFALFKHA